MIGKDSFEWKPYVWLCIVYCVYCSTNGLLSVNVDNSSFIINRNKTFDLNVQNAANRKVSNVQTRNTVECNFWPFVWYGNVYSAGKRMSKWMISFWHVFISIVSLIFNGTGSCHWSAKWEIERHSEKETDWNASKEFHSHLTRLSFRQTIRPFSDALNNYKIYHR